MRRSLILRERPRHHPDRDTFRMHEDPIPEPAAGEVVTRTIWLSIDPYMRGRLSDRKSYAAPVRGRRANDRGDGGRGDGLRGPRLRGR